MALTLMKTTGIGWHKVWTVRASQTEKIKIGCRPDFFCDMAATKQPTTKPMPNSNKNDHKLDWTSCKQEKYIILRELSYVSDDF
jgi:hypothetical protein